jgi:DNA-directed RNA polymerase II subunit RPB1
VILQTLNTFHLSGVGNKNVSLGVPRLRELIDVTKSDKMKTPSLTVYLQPQYAANKDCATSFSQSLIYTTLGDVILQAQTVWEPNHLQTQVVEDQEMVRIANIFRNHALLRNASRWVIRWTLNRELCLNRNLTPQDVTQTIREYVGQRADVVYSPMNCDLWIIRMTLFDIRDMAEKSSAVVEEQVMQERVLTQTEMNRLMASIVLGGIEGLRDTSLREVKQTVIHPETQALQIQNEWLIDTQGTSLLEVWALDAVDWARTISNDLYEIYDNLGIEAVAQILFQEIKNVLSDSYVNDRHILAAVKTMCFRGYLMPMSRHGINRVDTGVLMRVSFEESMEQLVNAAIFNETDHLQGVTETMMVGAQAPMGTGAVSLYTKPAYRTRMKEEVYGRPRIIQNKQRIFRSMITEWNTQAIVQQDDLDQLERPPSPPATPLWSQPPPESGSGGLSLLDEFSLNPLQAPVALPQGVFLPPPPLSFSRGPEAGGKKRYRPSSPTVSEGNDVVSGAVVLPTISHARKRYRPSSPELDSEPKILPTTPVEIPVSQSFADFIPVNSRMMVMPMDLFLAASQPPPTSNPVSSTMLPEEPATASHSSEPLLADITQMLTSLSSFLNLDVPEVGKTTKI